MNPTGPPEAQDQQSLSQREKTRLINEKTTSLDQQRKRNREKAIAELADEITEERMEERMEKIKEKIEKLEEKMEEIKEKMEGMKEKMKEKMEEMDKEQQMTTTKAVPSYGYPPLLDPIPMVPASPPKAQVQQPLSKKEKDRLHRSAYSRLRYQRKKQEKALAELAEQGKKHGGEANEVAMNNTNELDEESAGGAQAPKSAGGAKALKSEELRLRRNAASRRYNERKRERETLAGLDKKVRGRPKKSSTSRGAPLIPDIGTNETNQSTDENLNPIESILDTEKTSGVAMSQQASQTPELEGDKMEEMFEVEAEEEDEIHTEDEIYTEDEMDKDWEDVKFKKTGKKKRPRTAEPLVQTQEQNQRSYPGQEEEQRVKAQEIALSLRDESGKLKWCADKRGGEIMEVEAEKVGESSTQESPTQEFPTQEPSIQESTIQESPAQEMGEYDGNKKRKSKYQKNMTPEELQDRAAPFEAIQESLTQPPITGARKKRSEAELLEAKMAKRQIYNERRRKERREQVEKEIANGQRDANGKLLWNQNRLKRIAEEKLAQDPPIQESAPFEATGLALEEQCLKEQQEQKEQEAALGLQDEYGRLKWHEVKLIKEFVESEAKTREESSIQGPSIQESLTQPPITGARKMLSEAELLEAKMAKRQIHNERQRKERREQVEKEIANGQRDANGKLLWNQNRLKRKAEEKLAQSPPIQESPTREAKRLAFNKSQRERHQSQKEEEITNRQRDVNGRLVWRSRNVFSPNVPKPKEDADEKMDKEEAKVVDKMDGEGDGKAKSLEAHKDADVSDTVIDTHQQAQDTPSTDLDTILRIPEWTATNAPVSFSDTQSDSDILFALCQEALQ